MTEAVSLQFRSNLAKEIEHELASLLQQRMPPLEQILQSPPVSQARFARKGYDYFMSVLGIFFARKKGRLQPRTTVEVRNQILARLSEQLSTQLSNSLVDLTITSITEETSKLVPASQERVEEKFEFHQMRKEEVDLIILFDDIEVKRFKLTILVSIRLLINKIVILLQKLPTTKLRSLSFQDAEADMELSDEKGHFSAELKIPIQGELDL